MANSQADSALRQLRELIATYQDDRLPDTQLLRRYVETNDESAFAAIVRRHALLVLGVCRRVLHDWHAAEDVFQAVFFVLARKAGSIRKQESLGPWLHGVAHRLALKARANAARRHAREAAPERLVTSSPVSDVTWRELRGVLDEELARLPEKYRAPLLLCYLEGQTRDEAATRLHVPLGTLKSRLERGRELLRSRLVRRGLTLSAALLAALLMENVSAAAVPSLLMVSTVRASLLFAAGKGSVAIISARAAALAKGASSTMFATTVKTMSVLLLTGSALVIGFGLVSHEPSAANPPRADPGSVRDASEQPAGDSDDGEPGLFKDATKESGVDFTYQNGEEAGHYAILESLGGGGAFIDYDGDGLLDLFLVGGGYFAGKDKKDIKGHPCKLYKNLGNGKFKDVTKEAGLEMTWFYTHGCAVADYDNDGWPDLLVTGWHELRLFHNEPVDAKDPSKGRKFVEVTNKAGLPSDLWTTSAAWADFDGDGYPDLYVCQYVDWSMDNNPTCSYDAKTRDVCPPKQFHALPHKVFHNNGDGTFTDVSNEAGLRTPRKEEEYKKLTHMKPAENDNLARADRDGEYGKGLGVLAVDVNGDGKPDIYVANDTVDNFLYINVSEKGKIRFREVGLASGTARDDRGSPNGSMGVWASDYDRCGRPSIWVTNYENEMHALYHNECKNGRELFRFMTQASGIAAIGQNYVGFGTAFLDVNNDGWEDIFVSNGHAIRFPTGKAKRAQKPLLLRNEGKGKFEIWAKEGGDYFTSEHVGRGVMVGDLDNDGRPDLVISHLNEPVTILRNVAGKNNHWLGIELAGRKNRCVIGARITVEVDGEKRTRFAQGGGSYLSASDPRHLFGLGSNTKIDKLTVKWPNGEEQEWKDLKIDRYWRLVEGEKDAQAPLGTKNK
jgi:RNA polymerase sigma factor (sigma-70 family)